MRKHSRLFMNNVHLKAVLALPWLISALLFSPLTQAGDPSNASQASQLSAEGSMTIAQGSLTGITGSADFVVTSVQVAGDGLYVVLKGAAKAGEIALRVPKAMAGGLSLAVGQTVMLVAKGAGWVIESAGKVIGFIPNEAGEALLHSERLPADGA